MSDKYAKLAPRRTRQCRTAAWVVKKRYDKATAESRAVDAREKGVVLNAYACPDCGAWHVGKGKAR